MVQLSCLWPTQFYAFAQSRRALAKKNPHIAGNRGAPCLYAFCITLLLLAGCAGPEQGTSYRAISLVLEQPLQIVANLAHAKFQRGRQTRGVNRYDPWCALEIDRVSEQPQRVEPGSFPVGRIGQAFINDYNTRMPALLGGLSCDDLVFKETTLWMNRQTSPQIMYLRCYAPYTHCRFGPPLSLQQMQAVIGPNMILNVNSP